MKGALPIQPPLPSQRKANMFDFPSPGNYLSALRLAFLSLVICLLSSVGLILVLAPFLRRSHTHGRAQRNVTSAGKD